MKQRKVQYMGIYIKLISLRTNSTLQRKMNKTQYILNIIIPEEVFHRYPPHQAFISVSRGCPNRLNKFIFVKHLLISLVQIYLKHKNRNWESTCLPLLTLIDGSIFI